MPPIASWRIIITSWFCQCNQQYIHSGYFYSASSSSLLLRGGPDTARILCRIFTLKRYRQLWAKDLPKVLTWWLERDSNPERKASKPTISHHAPHGLCNSAHYCHTPSYT